MTICMLRACTPGICQTSTGTHCHLPNPTCMLSWQPSQSAHATPRAFHSRPWMHAGHTMQGHIQQGKLQFAAGLRRCTPCLQRPCPAQRSNRSTPHQRRHTAASADASAPPLLPPPLAYETAATVGAAKTQLSVKQVRVHAILAAVACTCMNPMHDACYDNSRASTKSLTCAPRRQHCVCACDVAKAQWVRTSRAAHARAAQSTPHTHVQHLRFGLKEPIAAATAPQHMGATCAYQVAWCQRSCHVVCQLLAPRHIHGHACSSLCWGYSRASTSGLAHCSCSPAAAPALASPRATLA